MEVAAASCTNPIIFVARNGPFQKSPGLRQRSSNFFEVANQVELALCHRQGKGRVFKAHTDFFSFLRWRL